MKKKHKLKPLHCLYPHYNPKVESQHINKFMKNFSSEDSHIKVNTRKITAAPSVSDKLPERVTFESKKQIIGLPKLCLGDAAALQASVNDQSELGSSETSNIPCASVCPTSCFEDVRTSDSLKAPGACEDQQPPQNLNSFQSTVEYQDQNVSDCQYDGSSCISKDNGENMITNNCVGDTDRKNMMSSVKFSGSVASEGSSSRNEPIGAKVLASECTKEPIECDVSMKLEAGCCDTNSSATDSLKGCDDDKHLKYKSPHRKIQNTREPSVHGQTVGDNDGTDELVDVRVCDICGDVGREALLALCSKCSDGAEHIYCMRIKMDTVPGGDWMCEECTALQVPKRQKLGEADRSDHPSNSHVKEVSRDLLKKDSGVQYADELKTKLSGKASSLSGKRPGSDIEVGRVPKRRVLEGNVQSPKSSGFPGKTQLCRISSIKNMNKGKYDSHQVSSLRDQNTKKVVEAYSPPGHRSLKLGSDREVKAASKSVNLEKSVQPLNTTVSGGKLQLTRVSSIKIGDKGNKVARQGCSLGQQSAKEVVAEQLYLPRGHGSPRPQQQLHEGKLRKSKSINFPDFDKEVRSQSKDIRPDRYAKESSESPLNKKFLERKLLKSMSFSGVNSVSPNVSNARFSHTKKDLRPGNERTSTKKCDSAGDRSPRFGPHYAAADGMKVTAHRTKVGSDSPRLVKNNVENQERKAIQENGKPNLSKEESGKSVVKPCEPVVYQGKNCANPLVARSARETLLPSHSSGGIRSPAKNVSSYPDQKANQTPQKPEIECLLGVDKGLLVASNKAPPIDLHPMKEMHTFTPTAVVPSGMSAVPESEFLWKGAFKLEKGSKLPKECNGIQAHLSTCASSKVANLVHKFCPKLMLKEVSRLDAWPIQFQRNLPTEEDIGIYFFAENLESYSRSYKMVLEGMEENDLALEADFDGVQLLVFPSSLLPARSQRWNSISFLWGVFRVRKVDSFIVHNPSLSIPEFNQGSLDPMLFQSSASTRSMEQSFEPEVAPLEKCLQGTENVLCEANGVPLANDLIEKEKLPGSAICDNDNEKEDLQEEMQKEDENANKEPKVLYNPCAVPPEQLDGELGENMVYLAVDPDACYKAPSLTWQEEKRVVVASGSSFSVDSGPSGSSDGVGCAKLDEGQVEQSQNPKNYDFDLNLNLSLGTELEEEGEIDLNLDLVLGFPQTNKYQPELSPKSSGKDGNNNLLVLSLGMPC